MLCYCSLAKPDPHTKSKTLVSQDWQLRLSLKETPDFSVNERQTGSCMHETTKERDASFEYDRARHREQQTVESLLPLFQQRSCDPSQDA